MEQIGPQTSPAANGEWKGAALSQVETPSKRAEAVAVDKALLFLQAHGEDKEAESAAVDPAALTRKIDWHIMPFMFAAYFLQFLDKSLLNYANVMGLQKDTNTSPGQFSYLAMIFFICVLAAEPAMGVAIQRLPVAKVLGASIVCWGAVVTGNAGAQTYRDLVALRVLLGICESSVAPALILISVMWYTRPQQPARFGIWFLGVGASVIVGSLVSYGFQFVETSAFKSWQIMFLVLGLVTIVVGALIFCFMPDTPMDAKFLTTAEKVALIKRLQSNQTGMENKKIKRYQVMEALTDVQTWLVALCVATLTVTNGASSLFSSTIIKGFGFSSKESSLLNIPIGVIMMIANTVLSQLASRTGLITPWIIVALIPGVMGGAMMGFGRHQGTKLAGVYLINTVSAALPLYYAWVGANFAGHSKKVTMSVIMLIAYCVGSIIGPLTFTGRSAPEYIPAKITLLATNAACIVWQLGLMGWNMGQNRRREWQRRAGPTPEGEGEQLWDDATDKERRGFVYRI